MTISEFYVRSTEEALRQGEIITNVGELIPASGSLLGEGGLKVQIQKHPFAIIMSQDCDLWQDFRVRQETDSKSKDKLLPSILFCQAIDASQLMASIKDSQIWKRIRQNKDERYQYLREVDSSVDLRGEGVPALCLDFKRYFTIPTEHLYVQVRTIANRRAFLASRYMEHLSTRFFYFQYRVALEEDHFQK